ncbi:MAG TPA: permease-like cell division protein FtsX [Patescibacteria group bacterium]|nr:permease-like cell division protein FtsX [Patescibacteria group bacterium]
MLISFLRIIKFALQNFWRNIWLSIATLSIIVLTLISVSGLIFISVLAQEAITSAKQLIDLTITFKPDIGTDQIHDIDQSIKSSLPIQSTTFISKEEALEQFKEFHKDDPFIQESLNALEDNPLGNALVVKANRIEDYPSIIAYFQQDEVKNTIQEFNKNFEKHEIILEKMTLLTKRIQEIALVISGVFILIAALIVFNTIRIAIYTHSEEISIMKLVGATNAFVRGPFIVESVFYSLSATLITIAVLLPLLSLISPYISAFFSNSFDLATYFRQHALWIGIYEFLGMTLLNLVATSFAIGKYLKV